MASVVAQDAVAAAAAASAADARDTLGKFGCPTKNKIVPFNNGLAYTACKHCGWNTELCSHTTGAHNVSSNGGYLTSFALKTMLNKLLDKREGDNILLSKKKNPNAGIRTLMMEQCVEMENDSRGPDQANFAGMMTAFMQKLLT